ncbi:MAG TPA: response regulator, partial [Draconibacterium sp.]|nr:response regulator [Draconibacterium sp.]
YSFVFSKTIPTVLNKIKTKIEIQKDSFDQSKPIVLIVDDEEEMCDFIASEISEKFNVLKAYNGEEAYNIICNKHVSLVVSDVLMPIMDGYELCKRIKNNLDYSHIPIILLTASISLNARIEGLECGADAYLEKPFTTELLVAQIENLFKNKEVASENFMNSPFTHYKTVAVNKIDEDFMKELHSIIVKHLSESKLSVEMIANIMGMSVSTLYRKVKAITKLNTNEYIRLYRLKKAAEMLASREYRINEVSYLVGFSSPSYFTTTFQKQFGVSPSQFLKQQVLVEEPEEVAV